MADIKNLREGNPNQSCEEFLIEVINEKPKAVVVLALNQEGEVMIDSAQCDAITIWGLLKIGEVVFDPKLG